MPTRPPRNGFSRGLLRRKLGSRKPIDGAQLSATRRREGRTYEATPRLFRPNHASKDHRLSLPLRRGHFMKIGVQVRFQSVESSRSVAESRLKTIQGTCRQGALLHVQKRFFCPVGRYFFVPCAGAVSRGELRGKLRIRKQIYGAQLSATRSACRFKDSRSSLLSTPTNSRDEHQVSPSQLRLQNSVLGSGISYVTRPSTAGHQVTV